MTTGMLILAGVGVVCAGLLAVFSWLRGAPQSDLGSVSTTWIAELRAGDPYDSQR